MEVIAASLYFLNFLLSAAAAGLAFLLFRRCHQVGWLLLAVSFLWPFFSLTLRVIHNQTLFPYRSVGSDASGMTHVTYHWQFPGFYALAVVALLLLLKDKKKT